MSTDKMRETFELTFAINWVKEDDACKCWELAWQASREALVIEWPDRHDYTNPDVAGAAILDCRTAFGKAVKVKP